MRRETRGGITLSEVLVLVAVVGLLLARVVPAIHAARAEARRESCVDNLKQLGLAMHNDIAAKGVLPMSRVVGAGRGNEHSVFMSLLPYMEQAAIYNAYNFHLENWHDANATATRTSVETYLSPENPDEASTPAWEVRYPEGRGTFAKGHYGVNWGGGRGPWGEDFVKQKGT